MIKRRYGYLEPLRGETPDEARTLHEDGYAVLEQAFPTAAVRELASEVSRVFDELPRDDRPAASRVPDQDMFRYEMLNRSAACQRALSNERVLSVVEPLLGEDCHVIANTAWRNPTGLANSHGGEMWHIDAGPHVPRPPGVAWPDEIPYPVFAVGVHVLLQDARIEDGPTGVIPGSHRSGQHPPFDRLQDEALEFEGQGCVPLLGRAGDVVLFVSDVWHRRMPTRDGERGRFFLQMHFGRRDIAQRLETASQLSQANAEAESRANTPRERTVIGLHEPGFYDG